MFDHLGIVIKDANKSLPFYEACLAPLGIRRLKTWLNARRNIYDTWYSPIPLDLRGGGPAPTAFDGLFPPRFQRA